MNYITSWNGRMGYDPWWLHFQRHQSRMARKMHECQSKSSVDRWWKLIQDDTGAWNPPYHCDSIGLVSLGALTVSFGKWPWSVSANFFFPLHSRETLPSPVPCCFARDASLESSHGAWRYQGANRLTWQSRLLANDPWTQTQESWHLDLRGRKMSTKTLPRGNVNNEDPHPSKDPSLHLCGPHQIHHSQTVDNGRHL